MSWHFYVKMYPVLSVVAALMQTLYYPGWLGLKELWRLCTNVCGFTLLSLVMADCDCWEDLFCQHLFIANEGCDVIW